MFIKLNGVTELINFLGNLIDSFHDVNIVLGIRLDAAGFDLRVFAAVNFGGCYEVVH